MEDDVDVWRYAILELHARNDNDDNIQCYKKKTSCVATGLGRHGIPHLPLTLTFNRLTLNLACELHLRWGTFLPNLGTLGLWVLKVFAMYATDGQTDGRTTAMIIAPFTTVGGITIQQAKM